MKVVFVIHMGRSNATTPGSRIDNNSYEELDSNLIRNTTSSTSLISTRKRAKVVNLSPAFGSKILMMASGQNAFIPAGGRDF